MAALSTPVAALTCEVCDRPLTDPVSRARGKGPVCERNNRPQRQNTAPAPEQLTLEETVATPPELSDAGPVPSDAEVVAAARQPAYDAVYAYIGTLPADETQAVLRNARIWRAVNAALDAMNAGRCVSSHCVEGDHVLINDEPATAAHPDDTTGDRA